MQDIDLLFQELKKCRDLYKKQRIYHNLSIAIHSQLEPGLKKNKALIALYYNWISEYFDLYIKEIKMQQDVELEYARKKSYSIAIDGRNPYVHFAQQKAALSLDQVDLENMH